MEKNTQRREGAKVRTHTNVAQSTSTSWKVTILNELASWWFVHLRSATPEPTLRKSKTLSPAWFNLCAFASLREFFCAWVAALQRYFSVVLNPFQYTNHFDLGGLREHVEGLNFLNPEAVGEPLEIAGEGRGVTRHVD
jgi:hypothetical protein